MRCEELEAIVFSGREISAEEREEMEAHAQTCEACRALLDHADVLSGMQHIDEDVTAAPDMVTVTANASVSGRSVADAQEGMNAIVQSATQKLLDLGVEEKDIVTTSYTYYPTYDYNSETPTVNGYQADHTLSITCKDVDMLDSVIGVVTDCGMSEIYKVEYDVSNRSELYRQALKAAIEEAAAKAEGMAEAVGMTIDHLESVTENTGFDECTVSTYDGAVSMKAEAAGTGIRSGSVSVTASVTAVYEVRK